MSVLPQYPRNTKCAQDLCDKLINQGDTTSCDHNIIDIDKDIDQMLSMTISKEGSISNRILKTSGQESSFQFLIPSSWGLFKPIESFSQTTNMMRPVLINETRWLRYIYLILESSLKESIIDVELSDRPSGLHVPELSGP